MKGPFRFLDVDDGHTVCLYRVFIDAEVYEARCLS
jgi:hypothetical protein